MKRMGVLFGQERTFPLALVERINKTAKDVAAEPVSIGGTALQSPRRYDLVLDRISQDIPFYRAVLKKMVADGTIVINNPFWWSADDKFFNNVVARRLGVAVPKTVILPSHEHPPDTTSESMSNLRFPLEWDEIFAHIGFPAYFKPYSGGGWKKVYRVTSPDEFFAAYRDTGQTVMTLQEEIVFDEYFRCYVIGRESVRVMRYDPREPHHRRYVREGAPVDPALLARVREDCLKLTGALGYEFDTLEFAVRDGVPYAIDFLNPAPDAEPSSVGQDNFEWVLEHAAKFLVERVERGSEPVVRYHWDQFLAPQQPSKKPAPRPRTPGSAARGGTSRGPSPSPARDGG
jgi:glutathione synthase/RimK-type ligase-like ATP-grasp enzyme